MRFPVVLRWRRSRKLATFLVIVHLVALIMLGLTSLEPVWLVGGALLLMASAIHSGNAWRLAQGELRLHADGRCDYRSVDRIEFSEARLLWHSEWPAIISLGLQVVDPPVRRVLVSALDTLPVGEQRLLRLWLRCCTAGGGAAPGQEPA